MSNSPTATALKTSRLVLRRSLSNAFVLYATSIGIGTCAIAIGCVPLLTLAVLLELISMVRTTILICRI